MPRNEERLGANQRKVLSYLEGFNGKASIQMIMENTGLTIGCANGAMKGLRNRKKVNFDKDPGHTGPYRYWSPRHLHIKHSPSRVETAAQVG